MSAQGSLYTLSGGRCPQHLMKFASKNPIVKDVSILSASVPTNLSDYSYYKGNDLLGLLNCLLQHDLSDKSKSVSFSMTSGIDTVTFNSAHDDILYITISATSYKLVPFMKKVKGISFKKIIPPKYSLQLCDVYHGTLPLALVNNSSITKFFSTIFTQDNGTIFTPDSCTNFIPDDCNLVAFTYRYPEIDSVLEQMLKSWKQDTVTTTPIYGHLPQFLPHTDNSFELYEYLVLLHMNSPQLSGSLNSAISSYELHCEGNLSKFPIVQTITPFVSSAYILNTVATALSIEGQSPYLSISLKTASSQHLLLYLCGKEIYIWEVR